MSHDKTGSGGLSFGPPPAREQNTDGIGFSPDIEEQVQGQPSEQALSDPSPLLTRGLRTPPRSVSYPLAEACLQRLLGEPAISRAEVEADASANEADTEDSGVHPFSIGPSVMRAPPELARPPSEPNASIEAAGSASTGQTDALLEDLVDVLLVGEDSGKPEVHLSFKAEVFGGLYLRLERRENGLFAHFSVPDEHARRSVQGHIDDLLARLSGAGFSICGSSLEVQENP